MHIITRIICALLLSMLCMAGNAAYSSTTLKIAYTHQDADMAAAHVVKLLLEKIGYKVDLLQLDVEKSWMAVAEGKADVMLNALLPAKQAYLETYDSKVENLGPHLIGTRIGLVVPDYVNILAIDELNSYYRQFDGNIFGSESNTDATAHVKTAMEVYKLDFVLVNCTEAVLLEKLGSFISAGEWIVVAGWSPHWMFSQWSLKYLDDPEGVYGKDGTINTIARKNLSKDHPDAWHVLKNFYWDDNEIQSLMLLNHQHPESIVKNTEKWLNEHPKLQEKWLHGIERN
jgi:glycine betaine/proline transport system substrate-binding protein